MADGLIQKQLSTNKKEAVSKGQPFILIIFYRIVNKIVKKEGDASPSKAVKFSNLRHAFS